MSIWDELDLPEGMKGWIISQSDQMIAESQTAVDYTVNELLKRRHNNDDDIPASILAIYLMQSLAARENETPTEEVIYNLCLLLSIAVYRIADKIEPPEELPPL